MSRFSTASNWLLRLSHRPWLRRAAWLIATLWAIDGAIGLATEKWWFESLGYGQLWRARNGAAWSLFVLALIVGAISWPVLRSVSPRATDAASQSTARRQLRQIARRINRIAPFAMTFITFWLAVKLSHHGDDWLLFQSAQSWGESDSISGLDGSYWIRRPFAQAVHGAGWSWLSSLIVIGGALHAGRVWVGNPSAVDGAQLRAARRVLWALGAAWFALLAMRYGFLICDGAGVWRGEIGEKVVPAGWDWIGWHWQRPLNWLGVVLSSLSLVACLVAAAWPSRRFDRRIVRRARRMVATLGIAAWWAPGVIWLLTSAPLWSLVVAPDEARREEPFLRAHIAATRRAWNLDSVVEKPLRVGPLDRATLENVGIERIARAARLWDERLLPDAATLNRSDGRLIGVASNAIYEASHLDLGGGRALKTARAPRENAAEIALDSSLRRFAWAWRARDAELLWRAQKSLRFRVDPIERARALLPASIIGSEPYRSGAGEILLDILAARAEFPDAARVSIGGKMFSSARDSLKMVVSSSGATRFFEADGRVANDPVLRNWRRAFPDLIAPFAQMPATARRARRYPKALFAAQIHLLTSYRSPSKVPQDAVSTWKAPIEGDELAPEYALLPRRGIAPEFILQGALRDGDSLAALLHASCDGNDYGRLNLWRIESAIGVRSRLRPSLSLDVESQSGAARGGAAISEVKRAPIHSKVLVLPLPRRDNRSALLLLQTVGSADEMPFSVTQSTAGLERARNVRLESVAVDDAADKSNRTLITAPETGVALRQFGRRSASELARAALRVGERAQEAMRQGDWTGAARLWNEQRALLESAAKPQ